MVVSVEVVRHPSHPARPLYIYVTIVMIAQPKVYFEGRVCASLSGLHRRPLHSSDNRAPADTRGSEVTPYSLHCYQSDTRIWIAVVSNAPCPSMLPY